MKNRNLFLEKLIIFGRFRLREWQNRLSLEELLHIDGVNLSGDLNFDGFDGKHLSGDLIFDGFDGKHMYFHASRWQPWVDN